MPFIALDEFTAPLQWAALDPVNAPSSEIVLSAVQSAHPLAGSPGAMRADIARNASGHRLQLDIAALDLAGFQDLTLWVRSRTRGGMAPGAEFLLRLELGNAAMPIGSPGNDWHRYLAPLGGDDWHYLRFALDDLPAPVRSALTSLRITIAATATAQVLHFDGLEAQTRRAVGDIDAALLALLDGQLAVGGISVPAAIAPDSVANPAQPFFRLASIRSAPDRRRAIDAAGRSDFTLDGYRLRPTPEPLDLFYAIVCEATSRADQARMRDHLNETFPGNGWLRSGNRAFRAEIVGSSIALPNGNPIGGDPDDKDFFLRVSAWVDRGAGSIVIPANDAVLSVDVQTPILEGAVGA